MTQVFDLPLDKVQPSPDQPRKYYNQSKIKQLAESIERHGLAQPILVRPWNGIYQIVHGERRYRAHQHLGKQTIEAHVKELSARATDQQVEDISLIENVERDDLTDIELAWEFKKRTGKGQTHEQIAETIGKSISFVTQRLQLLELSERNQQRLLHGELSFNNARATKPAAS